MRYLLDTIIVADLVRHPQGRIAQHIKRVGEARVCTSIIVAAELRYGAAKKGSARLSAQLEAVLGALEVLPFEAPADNEYGVLRSLLEQAGEQLSRKRGGNDLLIAAQALTLSCTIVTDNEREFGRVDSLPLENWLRSAGVASPSTLVAEVEAVLSKDREIEFAYLFGSHATGRARAASDLDVAVHLQSGADGFESQLRIMGALQRALGRDAIDVVVLNTAPLSLAGRVLASRLVIVDHQPHARHRYESLTAREFCDFRFREHRLLERMVPGG